MLVSDRLFPSPRSHAIHSHRIRLTSLGALAETFGLDPRTHYSPPHPVHPSVGQTSHTRREGKGNEFIGLGSEFQGLWGIFIHTRKSSLPMMLPPRGVAMWTSLSLDLGSGLWGPSMRFFLILRRKEHQQHQKEILHPRFIR